MISEAVPESDTEEILAEKRITREARILALQARVERYEAGEVLNVSDPLPVAEFLRFIPEAIASLASLKRQVNHAQPRHQSKQGAVLSLPSEKMVRLLYRQKGYGEFSKEDAFQHWFGESKDFIKAWDRLLAEKIIEQHKGEVGYRLVPAAIRKLKSRGIFSAT